MTTCDIDVERQRQKIYRRNFAMTVAVRSPPLFL